MIYDKFLYLYPPVPTKALLPGLMGFYQSKGWVGQIKKNGVCGIFAVSPDKQITCMNRHNGIHKTWVLPPSLRTFFEKLPNGWFYFVGEIMHLKTGHIKDTIYLYDCLVSNGDYLVGSTFTHRYNILKSLWEYSADNNQYLSVSDNFWIASNYDLGFEKIYKGLSNPEDEGLVLRDPNAKLELCTSASSNTNSILKCRKGNSNYGF